jgi:hypothetical protein
MGSESQNDLEAMETSIRRFARLPWIAVIWMGLAILGAMIRLEAISKIDYADERSKVFGILREEILYVVLATSLLVGIGKAEAREQTANHPC